MAIWIQTYKICEQLPSSEKYGLISQMQRAAISIPANIAEGSSSSSAKDYHRFLRYSLGSCFQLETYLIGIQQLELLEEKQIRDILILLTQEQKMLHAFIRKIQNA